jgi:hypothetical protein
MAACHGSVNAIPSGTAEPMIAPNCRRAGSVEEGRDSRVAPELIEVPGAEQDEGERGQEGDEGREQRAADSGCRVAHDCDRVSHRPRRHRPSATAFRNCGSLLHRTDRSVRMTPMRAVTQKRRRAGILACLMSTAVLMLVIAATAATAPSHTDFQKCGDIATLTSWDIRAKRVGCPKAKQVVRAYNSAIAEGGGQTQDVLGFRCKTAGNYGDGTNYRCTAKGHRVVRFSRGG